MGENTLPLSTIAECDMVIQRNSDGVLFYMKNRTGKELSDDEILEMLLSARGT